jgi:uncharacterized protein involved in copper resistance
METTLEKKFYSVDVIYNSGTVKNRSFPDPDSAMAFAESFMLGGAISKIVVNRHVEMPDGREDSVYCEYEY